MFRSCNYICDLATANGSLHPEESIASCLLEFSSCAILVLGEAIIGLFSSGIKKKPIKSWNPSFKLYIKGFYLLSKFNLPRCLCHTERGVQVIRKLSFLDSAEVVGFWGGV